MLSLFILKESMKMAKLKNDSIKKKIKATYGEYEIINPEFKNNVLSELSQIIRDNSIIVTEDNLSDIEVNNTVRIIRYMLVELTNIENKEYWDSIDDIKLDEMLNLADGDFKEVVQTLVDIMLEVAHDNRRNDIRKLNILNDKLIEFKESMTSTIEMEQTLSSLGLDIDKLIKMQNGDETVMKEFQESIIKELEKQNKSKVKRGRPKTKK